MNNYLLSTFGKLSIIKPNYTASLNVKTVNFLSLPLPYEIKNNIRYLRNTHTFVSDQFSYTAFYCY